MKFTAFLTPNAVTDILNGKQYYESQLTGLGDRFTSEVSLAIDRICLAPLANSLQYKSIRGVKLHSFPYLLFYKVEVKRQHIQILRVFNTYQKPLWK